MVFIVLSKPLPKTMAINFERKLLAIQFDILNDEIFTNDLRNTKLLFEIFLQIVYTLQQMTAPNFKPVLSFRVLKGPRRRKGKNASFK